MSQNENKQTHFIQIRPWRDCINKCSFCFLQDYSCNTTTVEQKKLRLQKITKFVNEASAKIFGLIGGDFFEGQLHGCENEWLELMNAFTNKGVLLYISANLINKQYFLEETLDALKDCPFMICTSYDEVGRFHTNEKKQAWFKRIEELHNKAIDVSCTCIPTQEFIESSVQFPDWLTINLCDPQISIQWLFTADKQNYHDCFIKANNYFNLPERRSTIAWFKKHPQIVTNYSNYTDNHSNIVYHFNENDELVPELEDRFSTDLIINPKCGHPYYAKCYADSDRCMMCDALIIAQQQN